MDNRKVIGQRINSALVAANKKQKELAAALGVTDNTISYFVSGKRTPNTEQLIKIAEFLNVSADYLLNIRPQNATLDANTNIACDWFGCPVDTAVSLKVGYNLSKSISKSNSIDYLISSPCFGINLLPNAAKAVKTIAYATIAKELVENDSIKMPQALWIEQDVKKHTGASMWETINNLTKTLEDAVDEFLKENKNSITKEMVLNYFDQEESALEGYTAKLVTEEGGENAKIIVQKR